MAVLEGAPAGSADYLQNPLLHNQVPIIRSVEALGAFCAEHAGAGICPYVAEMDDADWGASTSVGYMNELDEVLPNFLYVPVNIPQQDEASLRSFFEFVQSRPDIPAVNITKPHKSSAL